MCGALSSLLRCFLAFVVLVVSAAIAIKFRPPNLLLSFLLPRCLPFNEYAECMYTHMITHHDSPMSRLNVQNAVPRFVRPNPIPRLRHMQVPSTPPFLLKKFGPINLILLLKPSQKQQKRQPQRQLKISRS